MKNRSMLTFGLLALLALPISGCGGGGGTSGGGVAPFSYAGNYVGTWNSPSVGTNGNLNLTVAPNNTASGTMTGAQFPGTAIVNGALPPTGMFTGSITYDASHTFTIQGPASFSTVEPNHLVGTLTQDFGGLAIPINFDLVKQ